MDSLKSLPVEGGLNLHYRIHPARDKPEGAMVLIHGVASNMTRWSEFVERTRLKNSLTIIRPDLRGHGLSLWRGRLNMETWCRDLAAILDKEGYERAILVGHSLGAQVAVHFAAWYPTRTRGIVLIDPILGGALLGHLRFAARFMFILRGVATFIRLINRLGIYRRHIPQRDLRALDEKMREQLLSKGKAEELVEEYSSILPNIKHFPVANYIQEIVEMVRPLPDPGGITCPVLVVLATGVTYTDPDSMREAIERFPASETCTVDAFHWPLTEKPDETRNAIEDWIEEQLARPSFTP